MARAKASKRAKAAKAKSSRRKTKTRAFSRTRAAARRAGAAPRAKDKTFTILILAGVSESEVIRDVRAAICREVSIGGECNFRWVPAEPPMALRVQQWQATGDAIVDDLQGKYPKLVVKRQEIGAHYKKELTAFREFLTKRITG